jgi:hypothetical protein
MKNRRRLRERKLHDAPRQLPLIQQLQMAMGISNPANIWRSGHKRLRNPFQIERISIRNMGVSPMPAMRSKKHC